MFEKYDPTMYDDETLKAHIDKFYDQMYDLDVKIWAAMDKRRTYASYDNKKDKIERKHRSAKAELSKRAWEREKPPYYDAIQDRIYALRSKIRWIQDDDLQEQKFQELDASWRASLESFENFERDFTIKN